MYKQKKETKGTFDSPKGIGFFNHFPSNFLQPYGEAASAPDSEKLFKRVTPKCCEWYNRPRIAMSEFAATMVANVEILKKKQKPHLLNTSFFKESTESLNDFLDALNHLNTKTDLTPDATHIRTVLEHMYEDNSQFDSVIDKMFLLGGAMFSTAIHYKVAKELFTNPDTYADKLAISDKTAAAFKRQRDVKGLADFLTSTCTEEQVIHPSTPEKTKRNLMRELRECYQSPKPPSKSSSNSDSESDNSDGNATTSTSVQPLTTASTSTRTEKGKTKKQKKKIKETKKKSKAKGKEEETKKKNKRRIDDKTEEIDTTSSPQKAKKSKKNKKD